MTFVERKEEILKFQFSLLEFQCELFWIGKQFLMNYVTRQYKFEERAFAPYCWEMNVLPRFSSDIGMNHSPIMSNYVLPLMVYSMEITVSNSFCG